MPIDRGIVVFSGGSAANSLVDVFKTISEGRNRPLSYVIPITDNGGSTSELIRVFGGPGIGDLRSRLVRLIPGHDEEDEETTVLKTFFNHRLPADSTAARNEWLEIVEARHALWHEISPPKRELIRSFLSLFNLEVTKRIRPTSVFNFSSASIGNLFLTGARLFSGSLEAAIYLLGSICRIPPHISVLPAINSNITHHIQCLLADNTTVITGQNSISHPSVDTALNYDSPTTELEAHDSIEDANLPGSLPTLRKGYINFSKANEADLPARISRLWYINPYGQEIRPPANPQVLSALASSTCVIYSIGSLYTSIIPTIVLRGVGDAIATSPTIKHKVLILNGTIDRETGPKAQAFTATDFVAAIARAGQESRGVFGEPDRACFRLYVTAVVHLDQHGGAGASGGGNGLAPAVDRAELAGLGIETIKCYGRRAGEDAGGVQRYDEKALTQALEAVMGRNEGRGDRSRRNTIDL